jgi:hypothetical protein
MARQSAISLEIGGEIACGEIGVEGVQEGDWQGIDNHQQEFAKRVQRRETRKAVQQII